MKKPWSISTTVRNRERLREFLEVLKMFEGKPFTKECQINYQICLIQQKLYIPKLIPSVYKDYYEDPNAVMPFEVAQKIFKLQKYEDPPMRGRQSVNPLNKLGFAIARENEGNIKITELGNQFLKGEYDIGDIFFKSLLKLQFPNPWSKDFSKKDNFDIVPFIATLHLMNEVNRKSDKNGLSKDEFCFFVPTLINFKDINKQCERILEYRRSKNKREFLIKFAEEFYEGPTTKTKINNLYDYGDNTMRYFRLTRFFSVSTNPLGQYWEIDTSKSRAIEIEELTNMYDGSSFKFTSLNDYLTYLSDITKPELPWEKKEKLLEIALTLKDSILKIAESNNIKLNAAEQFVILVDFSKLNKEELENEIKILRQINLSIKEKINKAVLVSNSRAIENIINNLKNIKILKKYDPEQFEKCISDAFKIINDEIQIKPNFPVDDNGEPISHSPGNKPDIECYYESFKAIVEVTLNSSSLQWVQEGQPVMRHLRYFEKQNKNSDVFCIFIAPKIHNDTYSTFWTAVKYEYDGAPQKIVPLRSEQFAILLENLLKLLKKNKRYSHHDLYKLYSIIVNGTKNLSSYSGWETSIQENLLRWSKELEER